MTKEEAAGSIQLAFYAMAVGQTHGEVIASEMWYPRVDTKSVTTRKAALHRLGEVEGTMGEIARGISSEVWETRVSDNCRRCDFRRSCPAWPEGRGAFLP
jgi:predicted RecB family nuclease